MILVNGLKPSFFLILVAVVLLSGSPFAIFLKVVPYDKDITFQEYLKDGGVTEQLATSVTIRGQAATTMDTSFKQDKKRFYYFKGETTEGDPLPLSFRVFVFDGKYFYKITQNPMYTSNGYMPLDVADYIARGSTTAPSVFFKFPLPDGKGQYPGMLEQVAPGGLWGTYPYVYSGYQEKTDFLWTHDQYAEWMKEPKVKFVLNAWTDTGESCYVAFKKNGNQLIPEKAYIEKSLMKFAGFTLADSIKPCDVAPSCTAASQERGSALLFDTSSARADCENPQLAILEKNLRTELSKKGYKLLDLSIRGVRTLFAFECKKKRVVPTERIPAGDGEDSEADYG